MPPVQGPEVPVAGRNIPPRRSRPGPPQDPVDHLPVIVPPTSPTRRPVRQQRLQSRPLCISQIVTIEHKTGLPGRPVKIGETRPSGTGPFEGVPGHLEDQLAEWLKSAMDSPWRTEESLAKELARTL